MPRITSPRPPWPAGPSIALGAIIGLAACAPTAGAPRIITHGNEVAAGRMVSDTLAVAIAAAEGRWFAEDDHGRSEVVQAFAIEGGPPLIPGPLLRVREGTPMRVRLDNPLDSTLIVYGLHTRPGAASDSVHVPPHGQRELRFAAGQSGTYFYWGTTANADIESRLFDDSMLSGAFIIDPADAPARPRDRVFVIGNWEAPIDSAGPKPWVARDMMTLNGKSWPWTERFEIRMGDTLSWRWVNPTANGHPMHLHGTYFTVTSRGAWAADTVYSPADARLAVTELMMPGGTFTMRWTPEHPGNWLFHCHFAFHISHFLSFARVPDPVDPGAPDAAAHSVRGMRGMMLGLTVRDPAGQATRAPPPDERRVRLDLSEAPDLFGDEPGYLSRVSPADATTPLGRDARMGDPIIIRRGEPVAITVVNHMRAPTAIHWHGMELLSHSDGVPDWSGTPGNIAQAIQPADSFVARMDPPRAGTFIYHSHSNEFYQISAGIYGALIVLDPDQPYDPATDRFFIIGGNGPVAEPGRINGLLEPDTVRLSAGTTYRLRFININPDYRVNIALCRPDGEACDYATWRALAKDGADLPASQARERRALLAAGPGETADFAFVPVRGDYVIRVDTQIEGWSRRVPLRVQ